MAVFLRHVRNGLLYARCQHWTLEPHEAFDFRTVRVAQEWIKTVQLNDVEIVKDIGEQAEGVCLPAEENQFRDDLSSHGQRLIFVRQQDTF